MDATITFDVPLTPETAPLLSKLIEISASAAEPSFGKEEAPASSVALIPGASQILPPELPSEGAKGSAVPLPLTAAPAAPPVLVSPTAPVALTAEVDKAGISWDARIHSEQPTMLKSGLWRKRRNVDAATVAQVEAAQRAEAATMPAVPMPSAGSPLPPTIPVPPTTPATGAPAPPMTPSATAEAAITAATVATTLAPPVPPPGPDSSPALPAAHGVPGRGIINVGGLVSATTAAGFSKEDLDPILAQFGLDGIVQLANNPHLIPDVAAAIFPNG